MNNQRIGGDVLVKSGLVSTWTNADTTAGRYIIQPYIATAATVVNAGTGYAANDTITITSTSGIDAVATVITVNTVSSGAIVTYTITTAGQYGTDYSGTRAQASTTGTGTNATFALTYTKTIVASATAPASLGEWIWMQQPATWKRFGFSMKNVFARTAGSGAWGSCAFTTNSTINAYATRRASLAGYPLGSTVLGANTGAPLILLGTTNSSASVASATQQLVGKASIADGETYGGYAGFGSHLYSHDFEPYDFCAYYILLKPAAATGSGNTWTITTDLWECYE